MHPYESGEVDAVRSVVEGLGFRLYLGRDPFPPERPVFVGTLVHDGDAFRLHLHIIPVGDPEAAAQRRFRDDPALVMEYAERKRAILAAGAVDRTDYNRGKEASIRSVMTGDMDE